MDGQTSLQPAIENSLFEIRSYSGKPGFGGNLDTAITSPALTLSTYSFDYAYDECRGCRTSYFPLESCAVEATV